MGRYCRLVGWLVCAPALVDLQHSFVTCTYFLVIFLDIIKQNKTGKDCLQLIPRGFVDFFIFSKLHYTPDIHTLDTHQTHNSVS